MKRDIRECHCSMEDGAFMPFLGPPMPKLPKIERTALSCLDFAVNEGLLDEHIANWRTNNHEDPNPAELITGFMEMSWRIYAEPPKLTNRSEERELKRPPPIYWVKLALRVASSCEWDLQMIEKKLPFQIQRSLFIGLLTDGVQALEVPVADLNLEKIDSIVAMAYILYYSWVVHVVLHSSLHQSVQRRDTAVSPSKEEMLCLLEPLTPHAVRILTQAAAMQKSLPLPTFTASGLAESTVMVPCEAICCQVAFDLGQFHFLQKDIDKAGNLFTRCQKLLSHVAGHSFVRVDSSDLAGYLCACMRSCDIKSPVQSDLMFRVEQSKQTNYKGIVDLLLEDIIKRQLTVHYRQSMEEELAVAVHLPDHQTVYRQVCLCNSVRTLVDCQLVPPTFWLLFEDSTPMQTKRDLEFVCEVCSRLIGESERNVTIRESLMFLLRELCLRVRKSDTVSILRCSAVGKLISDEDWKTIEEVSNECNPPADVGIDALPAVEISHSDDPAVRVWHLVDQLGQTLKPSRIRSLLSDLAMAINNSDETDKLLYKCYDSHPYSDVVKHIPDSHIRQLCFLFQSKAKKCFELEIYDSAVSLLQAAVETVNKCKSKQNEVINILEQQFLVAQLLHTRATDYRQMNPQLLKRARCFVQVAHSAESGAKKELVETVVLCLLNSRDWDFLVDQQQYDEELWYQLASCCKLVVAQEWLRRGFLSRLWESVLAVLSKNVVKSEHEHEHKHRCQSTCCEQLVKFSSLIKDSTALSLLISCLVKVSNLIRLSKTMSTSIPLITSPHTDLWPNELSHSFQLYHDYISATLMSLLNHATQLGGANASWLRTKADLMFVRRDYRPALRSYLEAGVAASNFFAKPVPLDIWSNETYFRLVEMCNTLGLHMQAAVICQCTEPIDHNTAFKSLQQAFSQGCVESCHDYLWDISLLEFIIKLYTMQGQHEKRAEAVQTISQSELNCCNVPEVLSQASQVRRGKFFRMLANQLLSLW